MTFQIIQLVLMFLSLLGTAYMHGKPKSGKYNFWVTSISVVIQFSMLYFGGFFNVIFK